MRFKVGCYAIGVFVSIEELLDRDYRQSVLMSPIRLPKPLPANLGHRHRLMRRHAIFSTRMKTSPYFGAVGENPLISFFGPQSLPAAHPILCWLACRSRVC